MREACKLNGVDPYAYLKDVLARIRSHRTDRPDELLRFTGSHWGTGRSAVNVCRLRDVRPVHVAGFVESLRANGPAAMQATNQAPDH